jgi:hypothetical protein
MKIAKPPFILYPLSFGIFPVLALFANNFHEILWTDALRSIIFSAILSVVVYLLLLSVIREPHKAALLTLISITLFYSYGHFIHLLRAISNGDIDLGRHRFLAPAVLIVGVIGFWLTVRLKRDLSQLTKILNFAGLFLVILPLSQISISLVLTKTTESNQIGILDENVLAAAKDLADYPDVYYILVDGYPRADFIDRYLKLDISPFITTLRQIGFFVPGCSQANYTDTRFSMASTLNMTYLDRGTDKPKVLYSGYELDNTIKDNLVQKVFTELGYTIVTFESGFRWLNWENSDLHLAPSPPRGGAIFDFQINEFEEMLLDTSLGKLFLDAQIVLARDALSPPGKIILGPRDAHRARVLFTLEELPQLDRKISGRKFVYAHLVFPHPPFIVDASGNPLNNDPPDELAAYADQIRYLNFKLTSIVKSIIQDSESPPVIIIQGDHGATIDYESHGIPESERLGIFSAYLIPGFDYKQLQESFSPVNNFRLIFDVYFGGNYGLLEDKSIIGRQSPYTRIPCSGK